MLNQTMSSENYWAWRMAKVTITYPSKYCYVDFQLACKAGIIFG